MSAHIFRVRAHLRGPVVLARGHDIHLDGLLAWAWMIRHRGQAAAESLAANAPRLAVVRAHLPVRTVRTGDHRIALATAWSLPAEARIVPAQWTRRKDPEDWQQRARRLDASSPERPRLARADAVATPTAEWLGVGSRRETMAALELIHYLGATRSHGWGEVVRWEAEDVALAPEATWIDGAAAARNLPVEVLDLPPSALPLVERLAVEAPYWLPVMQVPAVRPGTRCALTAGTLAALREAASR